MCVAFVAHPVRGSFGSFGSKQPDGPHSFDRTFPLASFIIPNSEGEFNKFFPPAQDHPLFFVLRLNQLTGSLDYQIAGPPLTEITFFVSLRIKFSETVPTPLASY